MTVLAVLAISGPILGAKMSQGLLGLCCSIETRDCIEIITITAVLFEQPLWGIYCTDFISFLSHLTSQVKLPMQFMVHDNTEHSETVTYVT